MFIASSSSIVIISLIKFIFTSSGIKSSPIPSIWCVPVLVGLVNIGNCFGFIAMILACLLYFNFF